MHSTSYNKIYHSVDSTNLKGGYKCQLTSLSAAIRPSTPHSIVASFCTIMSDPNRPLGSRLKGNFKALYDRFSESRRPPNENLSTGSRLAPTSRSVHPYSDEMLEDHLSLHQKPWLWCVLPLQLNQVLLLIFHGTPECIAGSSQLHYQGF
jgi:hypothetical protein